MMPLAAKTSSLRPLLDTSVILGGLKRNNAAALHAIAVAETSITFGSTTLLK